jgi:Ras-related protein Rab-1A
MSDNQPHLKIGIIGSLAVGKTSLVNRLIKREFNSCYDPTISLDPKVKLLQMGKSSVQCELWEISGAPRFERSIPNYVDILHLHGIILMFDLRSEESVKYLERRIIEIKKMSDKIPILLLGNKIDLLSSGDLSQYHKGDSMASDLNCIFRVISMRNMSPNTVFNLFALNCAMNASIISHDEVKETAEEITSELNKIASEKAKLLEEYNELSKREQKLMDDLKIYKS